MFVILSYCSYGKPSNLEVQICLPEGGIWNMNAKHY